MAITRTAMTDDDGTGTTGTVFNNAWKTSLYDQIDGVLPAWTTVAYSGANFTAATGSWTVDSGDQLTFKYALIGPTTMYLSLELANTSVSATPADLRVVVPAGKTIGSNAYAFARVQDNGGANTAGIIRAISGETILHLYKDLAGANWSTATNNTTIVGQIFFEVT